jgi:glycine cleavage system H protein
MDYPNDRRYTDQHEWARKDGSDVVIGVTHHAQEALGDVVYVELPKVGAKVTKGQSFGVVESTKAVSELYAPVSGTVTAVNDPLTDGPDVVNTDPHGQAWMIKVAPTTAAEYDGLLTAEAYTKLLAESDH